MKTNYVITETNCGNFTLVVYSLDYIAVSKLTCERYIDALKLAKALTKEYK